MKKRFGVLFLIFVTSISMMGCSGKKDSETETVKQESPEKILKEAMEKLDKETLKAAETKSVTSYSDGMDEEEYYTCIIDTKNNVIERVSKDDDESETIYQCFNVKEKDGYGVYVKDELSSDEWVHYKEEVESEEESEYQYWLEEFCPEYTEENGYTNIQYTDDGEDELNGEKTIRIKVTADQSYESGEENIGEVTRESVLEEYEWTENEVALVEGFSQILDDYVKASNASGEETTLKCALTVWLSQEDHTILKTRSATQVNGGQEASVKEALNKFSEESWKVDMIHANLEDGMTEKEAKEALEEDLKAMEDPQDEDVVDGAKTSEEAGEDLDGEETDDYAEVTKLVVTKKIMTGKDCPKMSDLPKEYKEITQQEYFEGGMDMFEEDDYFPEDEEEFEDEFDE